MGSEIRQKNYGGGRAEPYRPQFSGYVTTWKVNIFTQH